MTTFLIVASLLGGALVLLYLIQQRAKAEVEAALTQAETARAETTEARAEADIARRERDEATAIARAEVSAELEIKSIELNAESERIRHHYEAEAAKACDVANEKIAAAREEAQRAIAVAAHQQQETQEHHERETARAHGESQAAVAYVQQTLEAKLAELASESERVRQHYETEALRVHRESTQQLEAALAELAPLRGYASLQDAENEVRKTLAEAIAEAAALRREAQTLVEQTKEATAEDRAASQQRAKEMRAQADALLTQATRDAGRIVEAAERRAEQIGGDAYVALRDKEGLERAAEAIRNVVEGYGDRYVIPTHSLLDELASDFGHTEAGESLRAAREQSRRMVWNGEAADCDYAEANRRETAIRFVIDAFNGRTDALLSTVKHNNFGTLEQEIRDAFSLVNLNGQAFRNARILPAYLEARLAELKWAVIAQELKLKEREEQRALQERIREEEKARREYERAMQEAAREEAAIRQAMEKARAEAEQANAADRAVLEAELAELNQRLVDAEAKGQRALSMAQQTRSGNVYVISNVGSFGDGVLKIGMTRRLIPDDRIKELSDASVPFAFDVHAMIKSDDAPSLERMLHAAFEDARINKVNYRKEFFRLPLERLRSFAGKKGLEVSFTMAADAREYRETLALEKMTPEEREKYHLQREGDDAEEDVMDSARNAHTS